MRFNKNTLLISMAVILILTYISIQRRIIQIQTSLTQNLQETLTNTNKVLHKKYGHQSKLNYTIKHATKLPTSKVKTETDKNSFPSSVDEFEEFQKFKRKTSTNTNREFVTMQNTDPKDQVLDRFNYTLNFTGSSRLNLNTSIFGFPRNGRQLNDSTIKIPPQLYNQIACRNITRPKQSDILVRNNHWQYFVHEEKYLHFFYDVYLDTRITPHELKTFPVLLFPEDEPALDDEIYMLVWYQDLEYPLSVRCTVIQARSSANVRLRGHRYGEAILSIALPRTDLVPTHVSIAKYRCPSPTDDNQAALTTYFEIVRPEVPPAGKQQDFAICMKALYGTLSYQDASYMINWIEALKLFGVTHVYLYNDGFEFEDDLIKDVFQYYINEGILSFDHFNSQVEDPQNYTIGEWESRSSVIANINDCFMRNIHKYKYIIHKDLDELMVPRFPGTYMDVLDEHFRQSPKDVNAGSLRMRSALHYTSNPPGNPEMPENMILLRQTLRQPLLYKGVDGEMGGPHAKKAIAGAYTRYIHVHAHQPFHTGGHGMAEFNSSLIHVHHYRNACKKSQDYCEEEALKRYHDDTIVRNHGDKLKTRINKTMHDTNFLNRIKEFSN